MTGEKRQLTPVLEIVYCAMMTSLLIVVQIVLGFVAGVELVTVLFLVFCYTFGWKDGMIVATAFSLIRCFIWGFYPAVVVLYLVYFNAFALLFGLIGGKKIADWVAPVLLGILLVGLGYFCIKGLKVSILMKEKITIMLWVLFGIVCAMTLLYAFLLIFQKKRELASVTTIAVFCTVCFTLLDDVISPLMLGYSFNQAVIYFYNGFFAMIPQTICTVVSVGTLFLPLRKIFEKIAKKQ